MDARRKEAPPLPPEARANLEHRLGAPPGASAEEIRQAFWRRLPATGFVPPDDALRTLDRLSNRVARPGDVIGDVWLAAEEERYVPQVEAFARAYFDLRPAERRARWESLREAVGHVPRLVVRLDALGPGLDLDATRWPEGDAGILAGHLCDLFVLPPAERAALRRDLVRMLEPGRGWVWTVDLLRDQFPGLVDLDPTLLRRLEDDPPKNLNRLLDKNSWRALWTRLTEWPLLKVAYANLPLRQLIYLAIVALVILLRGSYRRAKENDPQRTHPPAMAPRAPRPPLPDDARRELDPPFEEPKAP